MIFMLYNIQISLNNIYVLCVILEFLSDKFQIFITYCSHFSNNMLKSDDDYPLPLQFN